MRAHRRAWCCEPRREGKHFLGRDLHSRAVNVELRHLRYFVAVAEELHFTRAAQRLHMAQQPLSAAIARLEQELGVTLLARTTRRVELTEAGAALLEPARAALRAVDDAIAAAQAAGARVLRHAVRRALLGRLVRPRAVLRRGPRAPRRAAPAGAPAVDAPAARRPPRRAARPRRRPLRPGPGRPRRPAPQGRAGPARRACDAPAGHVRGRRRRATPRRDDRPRRPGRRAGLQRRGARRSARAPASRRARASTPPTTTPGRTRSCTTAASA